MYANLGPLAPSTPTQSTTSDEPLVTTEQTLLLKTLDAWINAGGQHHPMDDLSSIDQFKNLPGEFVRLSKFVRRFIADFEKLEKEVEKSGGAKAATGQDVDRRMIGAHQALVLILEVLVQLGMIGCEGLEEDEQFREESEEILRRMRSAPSGASVATANGDGSDKGVQAEEEAGQLAQEELDVVAELLLLLRAVMSFAPPVSPFKSTLPQSGRAVPEGHAPTSTGLGLGSASSAAASSPLAASKPRLDNLQRTLIQLLGVLVFVHSPSSLPQSFQERSRGENEEERRSVTRVQDRVRELGGLASVLGCTRVDERNPCESWRKAIERQTERACEEGEVWEQY
ncbi:hypothetical protein BCV69DRAFT_89093 [Microstroma glucosiphilum]|uniref:Uncharacterized protein n=1 Tax=Pseudomicrostroma glucosiphilum TaxID=1684307 RepID=A0A316U4R7_9BASI|nr:hypothetical protein BCV69DRAFT_89093 [Pseudomicrostroma glucosiphilum]PWN17945.1 hypothetical protein BCV69DRAFT_89093 [Pseudomicrostroma glucosiphilum]